MASVFLTMMSIVVGSSGKLRLQALAFVLVTAVMYLFLENEQFPFRLAIQPFVSSLEQVLDSSKTDWPFLRPVCNLVIVNVFGGIAFLLAGFLYDRRTENAA